MFESLKQVLKSNNPSTPKPPRDVRSRKAQAWGLFLVIIGLGLAVLSVFLEAAEKPGPVVTSLSLKSLEHFSIAVFLLGAVGVMLEFKSWSQYFEERLADTIMTDRYLRARGQENLGTHLINVFKAYYEKDLDYKGSFLEFFRSTLQDQIVAPFREEWHNMITISKTLNGWMVEEDITFKCRKVGSNSSIQDKVSFKFDKDDIIDFEDYSVTLTLPDSIGKEFKDPVDFPERIGQKYIFPKGHKLLHDLTGDTLGFELSLKPLQDIDGLRVHERLKYRISLGRFYSRAMGLLTKGFEVVFRHPEDMKIIVEDLGMKKPEPIIVKHTGLYSLTYESWLLPNSGLAYEFMENHGPAASQTASSQPGAKPHTGTSDPPALNSMKVQH